MDPDTGWEELQVNEGGDKALSDMAPPQNE